MTARSTLFDDRNIDRIETNLQIAHAPKSAVRDFRTDYLLKVFDYDAQAQRFEEAPMENQIDRDRILADDNLKRDFKTLAARPPTFWRTRSRHDPDPGKIPRHRCDRADTGRV